MMKIYFYCQGFIEFGSLADDIDIQLAVENCNDVPLTTHPTFPAPHGHGIGARNMLLPSRTIS